ncbi:MAG: ATP-dependent DNA helicase RecQ [Kofleriaceae bacterium]|nr:ATP-dependent DNA helicase RecQ [Kofleriaceae bacterium]
MEAVDTSLGQAGHAREGGGDGMAAASAALSRGLAVFGHEGLRPGQAEIIADIFAGRPVVAVMPTGAGKSLCYQLPAVVLGEGGGVTLVVSPLIALMKDQVDALRARGVAAVALTSAASPDEQRDILDGIRASAYTLVYVAPERFRSPRFVDALRGMVGRLALVAIDEAHCISEWGHDFRPEYRRLGEVVRGLAAPRVAAFTATATPEVRADIAEQLGLRGVRVHVRGFDRPNLRFAVEPIGGAADKATRLIELVRTRDSGVALVYAATRKNAERYAGELKAAGMRTRVYHAGLADRAREKAQDTFMAGELDAIVATNAFGMGIDKGDIHLVVHADIPRSPEAYYQEAGRGGRDGRPTRCVLLFNHSDVRMQEFLIEASYPAAEVLRGAWKAIKDEPALGRVDGLDDRLRAVLPGNPSGAAVGATVRILDKHGLLRLSHEDGAYVAVRPDPAQFPPLDVDSLQRRAEVERGKLKTMVEYAYWPRCRRQFVLAYFGDEEWGDRGRRCGACDSCDALAHGRSAAALSPEHARAIRALLLLVGELGGRFGRTRIAALATGTDDDDRFLELAGRGCLRGSSQRAVLDLLRDLEGAGLVEVSRGEYPTMATSLRGDQAAIGAIELDGLGLAARTGSGARGRAGMPGRPGGPPGKRRRR